MTAWADQTPVMSTLVVTGAPISPTVSGSEFNVYWKLPSQTMSGTGADGVYYEQPDVPSVMYFFQDWAIHGAYWRNGFGYAASHGCVNVPLQQAEWLYSWASVGTHVVVHS
ncbi:MAG: L,D-transpeptidase [Thermomicrobiales bacterium]